MNPRRGQSLLSVRAEIRDCYNRLFHACGHRRDTRLPIFPNVGKKKEEKTLLGQKPEMIGRSGCMGKAAQSTTTNLHLHKRLLTILTHTGQRDSFARLLFSLELITIMEFITGLWIKILKDKGLRIKNNTLSPPVSLLSFSFSSYLFLSTLLD